MVVSVTLGFMLYVFVRQSEGFFFKKRPINMVSFLFKEGFCLPKFVCF